MREVRQCPGNYVTKAGKVYSMMSGVLKIRKPKVDSSDPQRRWRFMMKRSNGRYTMMALSRLVADAYVPNPNNYPLVMHKDNNPFNNHADNLMWGTHKMNTQQMVSEGRNRNGRRKVI